ncbi:amidohydrolase family protein [Thalassotalea fonticola]|uniref:Amidohydrolase family protein n=1 Tax=Thalassotalea fonticola TaxID=3065649 RepID=A0ABZ0GKV4_9GAMM|nr:amidohydrolase family protein [Colwelliaceae bacterium S1-1]
MFKILMFSTLMLASTISLKAFAQTIALTNINVLDVATLEIVKNQTVVIEDNKIKLVTSKRKPKLSQDAISIDMSGKYIMPGLIDTHVHHGTEPDAGDNDKITRMRLRNLLRGGVTSVRDMGGDVRALSSLKRRAEIDIIQSPDIYYSVIIGGEEFFSDPRTVASAKGRVPGNVDWMRAVDENTNFDEIMLRALGTGATGIKIYAKVPAKVIVKLSQSAKKYGLKVWSHVFVGPARPIEAVTSGVETISHAADFSAEVIDNFYELRRKGENITDQQQKESFELSRYQSLIAQMKKHGTILDATMTVFEQRQEARGERGTLMHQWSKTFTKLAYENGVQVSAGTDGASDYFNMDYPLVHHEMQLLVNDAGLSPLAAIQAATLHGAEVIGIAEQYGEVVAGKVANLVILNEDPTDDIKKTLDIAHVIKNGEFVYLGENSKLPFSSAKAIGDTLWLSGQLGNLPSTMTLASKTIEGQMTQTMKNIGVLLQEHNLDYEDIAKCTLMLADINEWQAANKAYTPFFTSLPARSAFAASGLALGAKVEVECVAKL